ncbi:MAG: hypothetical protein ACLRFF_00365 [Alphaproteobacteria bacterium]
MKKLFLIFGLVVGLSATNGYAAAIGERLRTTNGWMACPPGCTFLRDSNGGLVAPLTCVDHGIECPGRNGGVRIYDDYPASYSLGEEVSEEEIADVANDVIVNVKNQKIDKKMDTAVSSVARAAKVSKAQTQTATTEDVEVQKVVDAVKAAKDKKPRVGAVSCRKNCTLVWDGYTATCTPSPECGYPRIYGGENKKDTTASAATAAQ